MTLTRQDLEQLLNPEQFRAATTTEGPLLILAGAGSGKTRVLVHRTAFILAEGLAEPWQIFMVTFTNKAAAEMRERLGQLIGPQVKEAWIGTFHALCARMLRMEGHRLGYGKSFTIYDSDDARGLLKRILNNSSVDTSSRGTSVNAIAHEIDKAKNNGVLPQQFEQQVAPFDIPAKKIARWAYKKYQRALQRSNAMDFGDLLLLTVELLKRHPEALNRFARRFKYVQVDEFQDTNNVQYDMLRHLVSRHRNLAVVGDDDQAIYRWRGADVTNILGFEREFESTTVVKLEQNYRSTATILEAANHIIRHNRKRHDKTLFTDAAEGSLLGLAMRERGDEEADMIAAVVAKRLREGANAEDFAVLYRQNAQSRQFEEAMRRYRVPYKLIGGTAFFERREVKDILGYLRVTANPTSDQDFNRIINTPPRGIGKTTVDKLNAIAEEHTLSGAHVLGLPDEDLLAGGLRKGTIKKLRDLHKLLLGLREMSTTEPAEAVARAVIERTKYQAHLTKSEPLTAEDRIENIKELVSSIAEHEALMEEERANANPDGGDEEAVFGLAGARTPLEAFLDEAALVSPDDDVGEGGQVRLLTLHAAKGLEFPIVFMVGMEEHTFPTKRAVDAEDTESLEEERRLCYVGMTRAKRELNLTCARSRYIYGRQEVRRPSRFLGELPNRVFGSFPAGGLDGQPSMPIEARRPVEAPPPAPAEALPVRDVMSDMPSSGGDFGPGARVHHNTFGVGVIEARDGEGPRAKLRIRFGEVQKTVVARFVRLVGDS